MIVRHDTKLGRFYQTPDGLFPSVTTVLSSLPNPGIEEWKARVGEVEANRISYRATQRGSRLHAYCESILKKEDPLKLDPFDKEWFKGIDRILTRINPIAIEKTLYTTDLKVAGTLDCFCKMDRKLCVLDFKTASYMKMPGEFDSYWLQTAVYANMLKNRYDIDVDHLCIVMQSNGETEVFWENASKWIDQFREIRNEYTYNEEEIKHEIQKNQ